MNVCTGKMGVGSESTSTDRKNKTEVTRCYAKLCSYRKDRARDRIP